MGIKKVWIEDDCIACGNCESVCPEVFHVTDKSHIIKGVKFNSYEEEIKDAADACPVDAIQYE